MFAFNTFKILVLSVLISLCTTPNVEEFGAFKSKDIETSLQFDTIPREQSAIIEGLPELSGLTMTTEADQNGKQRRIFWGHNDSGHASSVVALNAQGEKLLEVQLPLVSQDLEDIDTGMCPPPLNTAEECLWLADIGNNKHQRNSISLFIFPVPHIGFKQNRPSIGLAEDELLKQTYKYDQETPNVEAFVVDKWGKRFWLFEKTDQKSARVWTAQVAQKKLNYLTEIPSSYFGKKGAPTRAKRLTGADFSADGQQLFLRSYAYIVSYELHKPFQLHSLPAQTPIFIADAFHLEPQGEALCFDPLSNSIWTSSERKLGYDQTLHTFSL